MLPQAVKKTTSVIPAEQDSFAQEDRQNCSVTGIPIEHGILALPFVLEAE